MMPNHVHFLLSTPPKYSISQFTGYLKGKSAMIIFDRHANLKYRFPGDGILCKHSRNQYCSSAEIYSRAG